MFPADYARQACLPMGLKKSTLAVSLALGLGSVSTQPLAALSTSTLNFTLGTAQVVACSYGTTPPCTMAGYNITDIVGSYFAMDTGNPPGFQSFEKTPIGSLNGIVLGTTQPATGSHGGAPNGSESPNIDMPWLFANNTGMHQTISAVTVLTDSGATKTLDMSGWNVTWNGIASIPLVQQGAATITCDTAACNNNESYTLDAAFHVDGAGFTTVAYALHLEGTVSVPGAAPVANPDSAITIAGNPVTVDVLDNDTSATPLTAGSVAIVAPGAANGTTVDNANDTVTYTPNTAGTPFTGADAFDYTVDNAFGTSNAATVSIDVQANVAPVAVNDSAQTNTAALDNAGGNLVIDVLANDTDANNTPGLPGGINVPVTVLDQPAVGSCVANANGTVTYSQTPPSASGQFSCTYRVIDIDAFNTPLQSNIATVDIEVTGIASDWPPALDPDIIPVLFYTAGVPGDPNNSSIPAQSGSYFTMQVTPTTIIYTTLTPGPAGGVVIGHNQPATGSHTGAATGNEQTGIDEPWNFFSNTGIHLTRNNGITGNSDGTLEFLTKWFVSWNGIAAINLGGSSAFPEDLGFGLITCTPAPCADQSTFELNFAAHVQDLPGEPSGFNGVPYTLFLEGVIGFLDSNLKTSNGTLTTADRLTVDQVSPDSEVDQQCVGDCFDFTVSNVTTPSVSVVIPLAGGVPLNPVWRFLGTDWASFDTTQGDTIESAPFAPGDTQCPDPGDPAYGPLTTGHYCIELTIQDNGPNDKNAAVGTITDPSGMGGGGAAGGGVVFVDNRTTNSGGCAISNNSNPKHRGEWWLLAGFLAWLGWNRRSRTCR